jgi:hypothetical protein
MAHDCPNCYVQCYCIGDIDDINFGEDPDCKHWRRLDCSGHREYCRDPKCPCHKWADDEDEL